MESCVVCEDRFVKKKKAFNRTPLTGQLRGSELNVYEGLEICFDIKFTPSAQSKFFCTKCSLTLGRAAGRKKKISNDKLSTTIEPSSYIGMKRKFHDRTSTKSPRKAKNKLSFTQPSEGENLQ